MTYIRPMTQDERGRAMERDKINSCQGATRRDDLVKRLRHRVPEPGRPYKSDATVLVNPQGDEAADRIEALEAERDALVEKLEKAVGALREAETAPEPDHHVPQFRHVMDVIGATLAQITGGKADV